MTVEFLADDPNYRALRPVLQAVARAARHHVTVRTVDDAQYENRLRNWDFDIIIGVWGQSLSPGNEQRGYWGSQAADQAGLAQSTSASRIRRSTR